MKKLKLICILLLPFSILFAQPKSTPNAADLLLQIKKLNVLGSVLYIGAHPDDENTALLTYLAKERLLRSAYLSITRGEGGQNLLGAEKGDRMGIIRTQELLAARRIDGAEQYFTRAIDFGYSKSAKEALAIWGKETVLGDVVWVIRQFQPDVIIMRFPANGDGGHGHHTASAILAQEAFTAAADPQRFPEQLKSLRPWQARRLFWNAWRPEGTAPGPNLLKLEIGGYLPLPGRSVTEIAGASRSMHKSQGFGSAERRGSRQEWLQLIAGDSVRSDFMDSINTSWSRMPGTDLLANDLQQLQAQFQMENPSASIPIAIAAYKELKQLPSSLWRSQKQAELQEIIRSCAGLWIEAIADSFRVSPGNVAAVSMTLINRSSFPVTWTGFKTSTNDSSFARNLDFNEPVTIKTAPKISRLTPVSMPYWLRQTPLAGSYQVTDLNVLGLAEAPPLWPVIITIEIAGQSLSYTEPVFFRWTEPVAGELYRSLEIAPPVLLQGATKQVLFVDSQPRKIKMQLIGGSTENGSLKLQLPDGWHATPGVFPFQFQGKSQVMPIEFTVTPPALPQSTRLRFCAEIGGECYNQELAQISYPHIPLQTFFPEFSVDLVRLDLKKYGKSIGYVMGSGDEIPGALQEMGYTVTLLTPENWDSSSLKSFDAVIFGVRALNVLPELKNKMAQFWQYVQQGGTVIMQYNTATNQRLPDAGPLPFKITRDRVTEEDAPVTLLLPAHPVFHIPNKIKPDDFNGWIQERGLYFTAEQNAKYEKPMACHDGTEKPLDGGLLYLKYGKGAYIYTSYAWFRQLPAGNPGAFRLFANLIASGRK